MGICLAIGMKLSTKLLVLLAEKGVLSLEIGQGPRAAHGEARGPCKASTASELPSSGLELRRECLDRLLELAGRQRGRRLGEAGALTFFKWALRFSRCRRCATALRVRFCESSMPKGALASMFASDWPLEVPADPVVWRAGLGSGLYLSGMWCGRCWQGWTIWSQRAREGYMEQA